MVSELRSVAPIEPENLVALAEALAVLRKAYIELCRNAVRHHLGNAEITTCIECDRVMLPRRLWVLLPDDVRKKLRMNVAKFGGFDRCQSCYTQGVREGRLVPKRRDARQKPLDDRTLARLRQEVGITK
jgi:hypothetical protein